MVSALGGRQDFNFFCNFGRKVREGGNADLKSYCDWPNRFED